jgi:hypothetical protein
MGRPDSTFVPAGMPFLFRDLRRTDPPPPPGELHVVPPAESDRCLARLVLDCGPDMMPSGPGPVTAIVLKADPTLDDMLAGTIAARQLSCRQLPAGLRPFVEYAAVLRQGLSPGTAVPPERSLAGFYKAIRWKHGDVTDPAHGRRFADDWNRLASVIFSLATDGLDPFTEFPLPSWLFADDQRFLTGDRDLYLRDKTAGETWTVVIPDEVTAGDKHSALFLRRPQSRLWKEWARSDPMAPRSKSLIGKGASDGGTGFDFLAVDEEGTGNWVFSTNPIQRLPIRSLRDLLQKEEEARAAERAAKDPWVSLFDDTLVAAPHAGTTIPEADLLGLVKRWAGARPTRRRRLPRGVPVALAGIVLVALLGARWAGASPPPEPVVVTVTQEGKPTQTFAVSTEEGTRSRKVDVNIEPGADFFADYPFQLRLAQPVLLHVDVTLPGGGPQLATSIGVRSNDDVMDEIAPQPGGEGQVSIAPKAAYWHAGENKVRVRLVNDRQELLRAIVRVRWDDNPGYRPDLYVLAVGTSTYARNNLPLSETDARAVVDALDRQSGTGGLFGKVIDVPANGKPLLHPNRDQLLDAIATLKRKAPEGAVAWIYISGHGEVTGSDQFCLELAGENGKVERLPWGQVFAAIDGIRCPVIVLLDTCASGTIQSDIETMSRLLLRHSNGGRALISATFGAERGYESDEWKHSALCLASLECLTGECHYQKAAGRPALDRDVRVRAGRRLVTLEDFCRYVTDKVGVLNELRGDSTDSRPAVIPSPNFNMTKIPVAARP